MTTWQEKKLLVQINKKSGKYNLQSKDKNVKSKKQLQRQPKGHKLQSLWAEK